MKSKALITLIVFLTFNFMLTNSTSAAAEQIPVVYINNVAAKSSPLLVKGVTYVPVKVIQNVSGLKILSWDNKLKILKITDQGNNIVILQTNNTNALINGVKSRLNAPPIIKNGSLYVPLRFIAEAFNSDVAWNTYTKSIYIALISKETKANVKGNDLRLARATILNEIPYITTLKPINNVDINGVGGNLRIYFPEGKSNKFFMIENHIVYYYELKENAVWLTWAGTLKEDTQNPFLLHPGFTVVNERGVKPDLKQNWIYYNISTHAGNAEYGIINPQGEIKSLGSRDMSNLNDIFVVEDEK